VRSDCVDVVFGVTAIMRRVCIDRMTQLADASACAIVHQDGFFRS
jgi:hypothetical protein